MAKSLMMRSEGADRRDRAVVVGQWLLAVAALLGVVLLSAMPSRAAIISPGSFSTALSTLQAGAHPDITTAFRLDTDGDLAPIGGSVRDLHVELPKGLVGAANATPTCPMDTVTTFHLDSSQDCPQASAVGEATVTVSSPGRGSLTLNVLVFNVTPTADEPAAFGFNALYPVRLDAEVRSDGDYGITASATNLTEAASVIAATVTFWGIPADHNGPGSKLSVSPARFYGGRGGGERRAFLTNPTACPGTSLTSSITVDNWVSRGVLSTANYDLGAITGCDRLVFGPAIDVRSDGRTAGAPAGLAVDLTVPQNLDPDGLATPDVKDVSVRLPVGMSLSPSAADGLGACSDVQIGLRVLGPATCPDSSKIGTVELTTPLIDQALTGEVFLGTQRSQDPLSGAMYRLFIQVAGVGVRVKLAGSVKADPVTGQLTTSFASNPQLPFDSVRLRLFGGPHGALVNPGACGTYRTDATITSWAGDSVDTSSSFVVDQGCDLSARFEPVLRAGVVSPRAVGSSPFVLSLSRPSGQQDISALGVTLPQGLLADVASVPLCGDAQAAAGTCGAVSQIGTTSVAAGPGPDPVGIPQAGKQPTAVYLAGPYKGAPFSLSIVVPAQAGPFDLGTVVVRAGIFIDSHDAHVTVLSDAIPSILKGTPLDVQRINVVLDRPGFMLNPSSCTPMQIAAQVTSTQGAVANAADRFQVGDCAGLPFIPRFSASTVARTSRANGASLDAKIVIGVRGEANAHSVFVSLPKQLPSRLTTIQKACLAVVFAANPTGCPVESVVGSASAVTPLLRDPLVGPAYLVSHGGAGFPDLVIVLQGNGVRFDLVGSINISKSGVTSSKFASAPDVPINSFELRLPQGPHSILTSNGSLCAKPLVMPTVITGYNGKQVTQSTRINVSGCPKVKKAKKHKAKKQKVSKRVAGGDRTGVKRGG
ncbi:MAG TPA: hypothetical protein VLJ42_00010 [Solirubrobacteraceae bacterium]|nr:hypothetical protein [Solirubrobacteraceae bacterium]